MAKKNQNNVSKEIAAALKRFPKVVKLQEKRALEQQKFLKKTFGPIVRQLNKDRKSR